MTPSSNLQRLKQEFCDFIDLLEREQDRTPDLIPYSTLEEIMSLTELLADRRASAIKKVNDNCKQILQADYERLRKEIQATSQPPYLKEALINLLEEEIFTDYQIEIFLSLLNSSDHSTSKEEKQYQDMERMLDYLEGIRDYKR